MRQAMEDLPVALEEPSYRMLSAGSWGGMVVEYLESIERLDFSPWFQGLPEDMCPCPHWGYMLKGACHMEYGDGSTEVVQEGDVFYMPEMHTGWMEAGSAMFLVSPEAESKLIEDHFAKIMGG
jgi:hypothetical protein